MYIMGTKVLDRDYTSLNVPLKNLVPISRYGLGQHFYGGRVTYIGVLKDSPVLLLVNNESGINIIDTAVEKLEDLNCEVLKKYARDRNIEFDWRKATKEEVVELLQKKLKKLA